MSIKSSVCIENHYIATDLHPTRLKCNLPLFLLFFGILVPSQSPLAVSYTIMLAIEDREPTVAAVRISASDGLKVFSRIAHSGRTETDAFFMESPALPGYEEIPIWQFGARFAHWVVVLGRSPYGAPPASHIWPGTLHCSTPALETQSGRDAEPHQNIFYPHHSVT